MDGLVVWLDSVVVRAVISIGRCVHVGQACESSTSRGRSRVCHLVSQLLWTRLLLVTWIGMGSIALWRAESVLLCPFQWRR